MYKDGLCRDTDPTQAKVVDTEKDYRQSQFLLAWRSLAAWDGLCDCGWGQTLKTGDRLCIRDRAQIGTGRRTAKVCKQAQHFPSEKCSPDGSGLWKETTALWAWPGPARRDGIGKRA